MTIALLATGDEIVHGDTLNTNSHNIAQILSSEGLPLGFHLSCSDKEADIVNCLNYLTNHHDIIIIIGGLGPTTDDLTRFALAKFTSEPLIIHQDALHHIEERLTSVKVAMNEGNRQQALFPASATILPNPNGSAVGCCFHWHDKTFFLLPGPPRECLPMFQDYVLPQLQATHHSSKQIIKWLIFGLAESEIGQRLEQALADIDCKTGYRLDVPYIEFKVRCEPDLIPQVKAIIDPILAPYILSPTHKKASTVLWETIYSNKQKLVIIDDATGGVLETLLDKPGSHELVKFHNWNGSPTQNLTSGTTSLASSTVSPTSSTPSPTSRGLSAGSMDHVGLVVPFFHLTGLKEYWGAETPQGLSQLSIHYSNQVQEGWETHEVPYRTPLVVYYAAEWLSFRLLHLINQLHQGIA